MAGENNVLVVDDDGDQKAKIVDRARQFVDLLLGMKPRIVLIGRLPK
jgi:hypothetical protein